MTDELAEIRALIASDSWSCTFQTFGQYRTALLKAVDEIAGRPAMRFPDTSVFDVFKCGNCGKDQRVEKR